MGTPEDFMFGHKVAPLNAPASASARPAKDAHDLETGLALQRLASAVDEKELRLHASVFAESGSIAARISEDLTLDQAREALKAIEPLELNARKAQETADAQEEALVKAASARPENVDPQDWARQVAETRKTLKRHLSDPLEVANAYYGTEDPLALAAFESLGQIFDPRTRQLVPALDPVAIRERQLARGRGRYPAAVAAQAQAQRLASTYRQAAAAVKGEVYRLLPALRPQPMVEVAS